MTDPDSEQDTSTPSCTTAESSQAFRDRMAALGIHVEHPLLRDGGKVSATMEFAKHMASQGRRIDGKYTGWRRWRNWMMARRSR